MKKNTLGRTTQGHKEIDIKCETYEKGKNADQQIFFIMSDDRSPSPPTLRPPTSLLHHSVSEKQKKI